MSVEEKTNIELYSDILSLIEKEKKKNKKRAKKNKQAHQEIFTNIEKAKKTILTWLGIGFGFLSVLLGIIALLIIFAT